MESPHVALDLFAGTGWGVACQRLGVAEFGVENMPEAIMTRTTNGMVTPYTDAWDVAAAAGIAFDTLIASPPCQGFSVAGAGEGRDEMGRIIAAIDSRAWRSVDELRAIKESSVILPLHYVEKFRPKYLVFEQVPTVLPIWEAIAPYLRVLGYTVWVGKLRAERYGVPQTRSRAILMGVLDSKAQVSAPVPTHSKYAIHDPEWSDPMLERWVSIRDVLPSAVMFRSNYSFTGRMGANATERGYTVRSPDAPAVTITSKAPYWIHPDGSTKRLNVREMATLQSYPNMFEFCGSMTSQRLQVGNAVPPVLGEAILRQLWSQDALCGPWDHLTGWMGVNHWRKIPVRSERTLSVQRGGLALLSSTEGTNPGYPEFMEMEPE